MMWNKLLRAIGIGLLMLLLLSGCVRIPFDVQTMGAVDVIVDADGETRYYAVSRDGRVQETEAFEATDLTVYEAPLGCFNCFLGYDNGGDAEFINRLMDVRLLAAQGQPVMNTPLLNDILLAASELEHDLWKVSIFRVGEEYFLQTALNVNWVSPYDLYWYDQERGGLVEVCSFNDQEVVGLRVRDLAGLASRTVYQPDRPDRVRNPVMTLGDGAYRLEIAGDAVNLVGPEGVVVRGVTAFGYTSGGDVVLAQGSVPYWALDEHGGCTGYATMEEMPEWALRLVTEQEEMRTFRFVYPADDDAAADAVLARFIASRTQLDAGAETIWRYPDILQYLGGRMYRLCFWGQDAPYRPIDRVQYEGCLPEEEWAKVKAMYMAAEPWDVGTVTLPGMAGMQAFYLHDAVIGASGRATPVRLYHIPSEELDVLAYCAAGWSRFKALGDGWYMALLETARTP